MCLWQLWRMWACCCDSPAISRARHQSTEACCGTQQGQRLVTVTCECACTKAHCQCAHISGIASNRFPSAGTPLAYPWGKVLEVQHQSSASTTTVPVHRLRQLGSATAAWVPSVPHAGQPAGGQAPATPTNDEGQRWHRSARYSGNRGSTKRHQQQDTPCVPLAMALAAGVTSAALPPPGAPRTSRCASTPGFLGPRR
jgi:hypothetical protein